MTQTHYHITQNGVLLGSAWTHGSKSWIQMATNQLRRESPSAFSWHGHRDDQCPEWNGFQQQFRTQPTASAAPSED